MQKCHTVPLRKQVLVTAITTALGLTAPFIPTQAMSDTYVWGTLSGVTSSDDCLTIPDTTDAATILFTILDGAGNALVNSSIPAKGNNQFQTETCGTLTYDTMTETGSANIAPFQFFSGDPTLPATAVGISIQKLDSVEGNGNDNLMLSNMLFNWNTSNGIPVSTVWDAQALLDEMDGTPSTFGLNADGSLDGTETSLSGAGGIPASDGIYVGAAVPGTGNGPGGFGGYLALGPTPIATTGYNTTDNCTPMVDCLNEANSGILPLIIDSDTSADYTQNTGGGATPGSLGSGSSPMLDGPFAASYANFDFTALKLISFTDTTAPTLSMNAHVSPAGTTPLTLTIGTDTYTEPGATCTDAAPLNTDLDAAVVIGGDPVDDGTVGSYDVTYDCQDASGNSAGTETRTVNVVTAGIPSISLSGTTPIAHECATTYVDAGATASDLPSPPGDGDLSASIIATLNNGIDLTKGIIDEDTVGSQTIDYDVQDSAFNDAPTVTRVVNVEDTTPPVLSLNGNDPDNLTSTTAQNGGPAIYPDSGATVVDSCDTTLGNGDISLVGTVDMQVPDTGAATVPTTLTYEATDTTGIPGNKGTIQRTVNITRSQPVITDVIGGGILLNVGDVYTEQGVTVIDEQELPGGSSVDITAPGTVSGLTLNILGTVDTSTAGVYTLTYEVMDNDGNANITVATRDVTVGGLFASNSNFTMLDSNGNSIGGTNDVAFSWDGTSFNTDETDTDFTVMEIFSAKPQPFNNFVWDAHHIRVFQGPANLSFDTTCTTGQLEAGMGGPSNPCTTPFDSTNYLDMDIPAGQIGAHILFNWNTTDDIDVVNVWEPNGTWDFHAGSGKPNDLHKGNSLGTAGFPPSDTTVWAFVSTDFDGDNVNGSAMIDGPFAGSNANFSAGPVTRDTTTQQPTEITARDTKIGDGPFASSTNIWGLLASLVTLLGLRRFNRKRNR